MLVGTHQGATAAADLVIDISHTCLDRVYNFKYLAAPRPHPILKKDHVEYIGNKISSRLGILHRAHKALPKFTCLMLYNNVVLPLFGYCWSVVDCGWESCGFGS